MAFEVSENLRRREFSAQEIVSELQKNLPMKAREVITENLDISDPRNRNFLEHPDDPAEHAKKWHQWGIITHTERFNKVMDTELPEKLREWDMAEKINILLNEKIGDLSKMDLLKISIPCHDWGKFKERKMVVDESNDGYHFKFENHEIASAVLIRDPKVKAVFKERYGLTEEQIEYIAKCAELHFELGHLRDGVRENSKFNIAYVEGEDFVAEANKIRERNPDFEIEMGVLFLGDSLAKTDLHIKASTDEEVAAQMEYVQEELRSRGLDPRLINGILQQPVSMAAAKRYLAICLAHR